MRERPGKGGSEGISDMLIRTTLAQPEERQTFDVWLRFSVCEIKTFQGLTVNRSSCRLASFYNIHGAVIKDLNAPKILSFQNILSTQK